MNRVRQQIVHAGQAPAGGVATRNPGERLRHDEQRKVPAAAGGAGVADVLGAVVVDFERGRSERQPAVRAVSPLRPFMIPSGR